MIKTEEAIFCFQSKKFDRFIKQRMAQVSGK